MPRGKKATQGQEPERVIVTAEVDRMVAKTMPVVTALRCEKCGALHDAEQDTFVTIAGEIRIGTSKSITGDNLDEKGKLIRSTILCRQGGCLEPLFEALLPKV